MLHLSTRFGTGNVGYCAHEVNQLKPFLVPGSMKLLILFGDAFFCRCLCCCCNRLAFGDSLPNIITILQYFIE
ncbi:Os01g0894075 [Oryza sativa Japonica Group]|uniref:Os01g0894075 protein n=1 Tax=Oryza sativa subsp. japonica TaxID=39947 RepID=A0A0P0VBR3_ORYSJ|nr:hypothetical protein EE612_007340 [Oryza sativa]BAS75684.1 Os01g0894075 [Oryza sativa Japonica Group]